MSERASAEHERDLAMAKYVAWGRLAAFQVGIWLHDIITGMIALAWISVPAPTTGIVCRIGRLRACDASM